MSDDPIDDVDPFDDFADDVPDGDPFDDLEPDADDADDVRMDDDASEDARRSDVTEQAERTDADPFADLDEAIDEDSFAGGDWDASGTDESVWEDLSAEPGINTEEEDGRRVSEVDKHRFCEQCRYVTDPPEIACTHEGTEILSFLDMDTVRVVDCPIVEERERLERGGFQE